MSAVSVPNELTNHSCRDEGDGCFGVGSREGCRYLSAAGQVRRPGRAHDERH
jgi:hypothetical protein